MFHVVLLSGRGPAGAIGGASSSLHLHLANTYSLSQSWSSIAIRPRYRRYLRTGLPKGKATPGISNTNVLPIPTSDCFVAALPA
jgi:hypothetical protein